LAAFRCAIGSDHRLLTFYRPALCGSETLTFPFFCIPLIGGIRRVIPRHRFIILAHRNRIKNIPKTHFQEYTETTKVGPVKGIRKGRHS